MTFLVIPHECPIVAGKPYTHVAQALLRCSTMRSYSSSGVMTHRLPAAHVSVVHFVAALFADLADALLVVFPEFAGVARKERIGVRFAASRARPFKRVAAHSPTTLFLYSYAWHQSRPDLLAVVYLWHHPRRLQVEHQSRSLNWSRVSFEYPPPLSLM